MSLIDTFETQQFGPHSDNKWEEQEDFSSVVTPTDPVSFDSIRPQVVAEARAHLEQVYIDVKNQVDENKF